MLTGLHKEFRAYRWALALLRLLYHWTLGHGLKICIRCNILSVSTGIIVVGCGESRLMSCELEFGDYFGHIPSTSLEHMGHLLCQLSPGVEE